MKVEHQSSSLVLTAAYTYSKSMDTKSGAFGVNNEIGGWASPTDIHNLRRDYGPSAYNLTNRAVFSFVYALPVGRGKALASNINKVADAVIGGWQVNGIVSYQSGPPFSIAATDAFGEFNNYWQFRATQVGNPKSGFHKSINEWFNTDAFVNPQPGVYGNSARDLLKAPGSENWDTSLFKEFSLIPDRAKFQLRGEFFNTFNHVNYGTPDTFCNAVKLDKPGAADNDFRCQSPTVAKGGNFGTFGRITGAAPGRIAQVAAKIVF